MNTLSLPKIKASVVLLAPVFILLAACGGESSQSQETAALMESEASRPANYMPDASAALIGDSMADGTSVSATQMNALVATQSDQLASTAGILRATTATGSIAATGTRDPLKQPFATNSIWNTPIGSGAVYVAANLPTNPGNNIWARMPGVDDEHIVQTPTAPLTAINMSNAGWSGKNRCSATGGLLVKVPMPNNWIVPHSSSNSSSSFLLADGRTIIQTQPLARCSAGGPATSLVKFAAVDLYGPGITGAHGGSGMSAIGGTIRVGELRPGSTGPRHVLKLTVYAKEALYNCKTRSDCSRWPAVTSDSYAVGFYGSSNSNSNTAMKMGALLAIPASKAITTLGLETEPAKQLAWTLQNYGAYIVDDTYAPGFFLNAEVGPAGSVITQFKNDYGFAIEQKVQGNTPWMRDMQRLSKALFVVNNNSPTQIGGGGTPRQPLAAQIYP